MSNSADPVDQGCEHEQQDREAGIEEVRVLAAAFKKGNAGTCIECGIWFSRVVLGRCGKCRDELGLP